MKTCLKFFSGARDIWPINGGLSECLVLGPLFQNYKRDRRKNCSYALGQHLTMLTFGTWLMIELNIRFNVDGANRSAQEYGKLLFSVWAALSGARILYYVIRVCFSNSVRLIYEWYKEKQEDKTQGNQYVMQNELTDETKEDIIEVESCLSGVLVLGPLLVFMLVALFRNREQKHRIRNPLYPIGQHLTMLIFGAWLLVEFNILLNVEGANRSMQEYEKLVFNLWTELSVAKVLYAMATSIVKLTCGRGFFKKRQKPNETSGLIQNQDNKKNNCCC